ncbi:FimV/HubP family polar landmark protein [Halopseudomonas pertucinogena]|uniref:Motility protein FimV n=1 Tax=Halopseudomonas pertucinogena TaxID=86175 RepID=A0ABQ2CLV7_9GAMM|nr:FimV/HubP family polar landmark protein [Halopseudomonas pertucinogena]GGI94575.1 motility protein FimV [Halopseudomonas pertucinogena]
MVRKLVLAVAAASALMSSGMAQALGVGDINLRSALNQPLDAEIELLQVRDLSSAEIRSVLASPDDFGRAGIDRSFFLTDLTFTPVVQPNGKAYIKVTSSRPVREPYLNFLMEVRWPSGRVLREFTLLLDPPLYDPTPVSMAAAVSPAAASSTGTVRAPADKTPASAASSAPARPGTAAAAASGDGTHRTTRDDTLWGIALQVRPEGSSVHQTMLAIQDLNPNAFIGNNINNLKAGQTLTLPTAEQAAVRSRSEAIAEVGAQTVAWQNRQPAAEPAQRQLDARERTVAADAPSQTSGEDSLRLVAGSAETPEDQASSSGGNGDLRDTLDQTREQLDSAEQAKAELADRLADVEGQLETLQRLLTLKDAQLAALQRELAGEDSPPDILPVPEEELTTDLTALEQLDALAPVEPPATPAGEAPVAGEPAAEEEQQEGGNPEKEEEGEQLALTPAVAPASETGPGPNGGKPAATPPAPEPAAAPAPSQAAAPEAMLQRLMQNQTLLLGTGAVALLVLLLILMSIARRNARREAELMDNSGPLLAGGAAASAAMAADEGDDFNVAVAQAEVPEQVDHVKVEEQPQTVALSDEQDFGEYQVDEDVQLTDSLVEDADTGLQAQPILDDERELEPELPDAETTEFDLADFGLEEEAASSLASSTGEEDIGFDLDFDLDDSAAASTSAQPVAADIDVLQTDEFEFESPVAEPAADDFDLNLDEELQADNLLAEFEALDSGSATTGQTDDVGDDSFSLTDEELAGFEAQLQSAMQGEAGEDISVTEQRIDSAATDQASSGDLMSEGLDEDFDFLSDTDECATKLDLARAYIDMGDEEGARDILAEVVEEGNDQQQQDAREMMEQLG